MIMKKRLVTIMLMLAIVIVVVGDDTLLANAETIDNGAVTIIGHRGFAGEYPENTAAAFQAAVDAGVQWVEFDVRKSADGALVIYHDDTLGKLVGDDSVTKGVADFNYLDLQKLDAGKYMGDEFAGQKILVLDDVLSLLKDTDVSMIIELKNIGDDASFANEVYARCRAYDMLDRVVFASFNYSYLERIKELNYSQPTMLLRNKGRARLTRRCYADIYGINADNLRQGTIDKIHEAGAKAYVYTVDNPGKIQKFVGMGIDGIITNYPANNAQ